MFWFLYFLSSLIASLILAKLNKRYFFELFIFFLIILMTPTQIVTSVPEYAPAIYTFIFNILFEQNFSTLALRPVFLTIPLTLITIMLYLFIKRKFF